MKGCNAPPGVERVETDKVVSLRRILRIVLQQLRDVLVVVYVRRHGVVRGVVRKVCHAWSM